MNDQSTEGKLREAHYTDIEDLTEELERYKQDGGNCTTIIALLEKRIQEALEDGVEAYNLYQRHYQPFRKACMEWIEFLKDTDSCKLYGGYRENAIAGAMAAQALAEDGRCAIRDIISD